MARKIRVVESEVNQVEKTDEVKEIIELYYFDSPNDCKDNFEPDKTVGFERIENRKLAYQSGKKTAYCIKKVK